MYIVGYMRLIMIRKEILNNENILNFLIDPLIESFPDARSRPVARLGQGGGAIAPPNIFFAPPNEVGLSFRIFVCIHLLCEINVQCMLCSP